LSFILHSLEVYQAYLCFALRNNTRRDKKRSIILNTNAMPPSKELYFLCQILICWLMKETCVTPSSGDTHTSEFPDILSIIMVILTETILVYQQ
jgi:hypothetical protein